RTFKVGIASTRAVTWRRAPASRRRPAIQPGFRRRLIALSHHQSQLGEWRIAGRELEARAQPLDGRVGLDDRARNPAPGARHLELEPFGRRARTLDVDDEQLALAIEARADARGDDAAETLRRQRIDAPVHAIGTVIRLARG